MTTLSPAAVAELCRGGKQLLIDVRTPAEFEAVHAADAKNIPLDRLDAAALRTEMQSLGCERLLVICQFGKRAQMACEKLAAAGIPVVNVHGGTAAWDQAGLPVVRGRVMMSLERQVRIAAGMIVLAGILMGFLLHPALFGLSAFVGAGLVFSGVTDTCPMGLLLARMPWNQRRTGAGCAVSA